VVQRVNAVRDLGVTLDSELSTQNHVNKVARTCFYHIRRLKQVRKLLRPDVAAKLIASLVFSRLDYCNAILAGLPRSTIAPLQRVQNAAVRLDIARLGPRDHVTPTLTDRHWLPVEQRIVFKLCLLMHQVHTGRAPSISSQLRQRISRHHFTSSSALHQQSTLRTPAHAFEVRRTFVFVCRTNSLE